MSSSSIDNIVTLVEDLLLLLLALLLLLLLATAGISARGAGWLAAGTTNG